MSQWLIVGLGNPGEKYARTRHNVGFETIGELVDRHRLGSARLECNALVWRNDSLVLVAPQTYMNRSGYSARCLVEKYDFELDRVAVVYDEVRLPLGRLRFRSQGSPGGHRGMESVVENLRSSEIARLRLGVGPEETVSGEELAEFVLGRFTDSEQELAGEMCRRAADALDCWMSEGVQATMNRYNG